MHNGFGDGLFELCADVCDVGADVDRNLAQVLVSGAALVDVLPDLMHACTWHHRSVPILMLQASGFMQASGWLENPGSRMLDSCWAGLGH